MEIDDLKSNLENVRVLTNAAQDKLITVTRVAKAKSQDYYGTYEVSVLLGLITEQIEQIEIALDDS